MEEPPSSSDGLQPQDLPSARGLPNIFDLTRSRDECLLKASPIDALRVVQGPGWFVNPGTSNGSILPESDPLPTDQIPADEAFSNTAVMLSYLSRSHVFSEHSPVYGVPSAFLRAYDPGKLAEDGALVEQQIPVGLTACEPFGFMSPAQVVENMAAFCYLQQPPNMENLALETLKSLQADPSECRFPISVDELQNANALWNVGPFEGGFPEDNGTDPEGLCPNANPELVFLVSRSEEPDALPNEPLNQDFISPGSPLVENEAVDAKQEKEESDLLTGTDPEGLCPNANPELVFLLSRSEEPDALPNEPLNQDFISPGSPLVEQAENEAVDPKQEKESDLPTGTDPEGLCPNANPELVFLISRSEEPDALPNEPLNQDFISPGSPLVENEGVDAKLEEEEESDLPTESPDGERDPEGLCPNANPELVFLISRSEEPVALPNEPLNQDFISPGSPLVEQAENEAVDAKSDLPTESPKPTNDPSAVQTDTETSDGLSSLSTKKTLERRKLPPRVLRGTRAIIQSIQPVRSRLTKSQANKNKSSILPDVFEEKKREEAEIRRSKRRKATRSTSSPPNPQRKRTHHSSPISRSATPHKRPKKSHASKRKKHTSFFPPQEPEIKLKCLNWKEEKKEVRDEAFSPYVRVHLKDFPSCKVVNYPESKRGNRPPCSGVVSGVMPATPGLRFGRASADGTRQELLVCCLCGGSSNAMDLGDLHGPYFPEGYKTASKVASNPEQEENSDSCGSWTNSFHRLAESSSDWFSPPVVPLDAGEHWLHQDCGVWAAGVFLVRGKLYGLDEAIRLAKVSVCSTCQKRGATLGCVFKGCPNKFHYMCAVQSGCVLNEENFSIKCRKHKSRSIKGSSCGQINR